MAIEPSPHLTKAGKYLFYVLGTLTLMVMCGLMINACIRRPVVVTAEREWTQGYEHPAGYYMEPDHGALYYWWVTRAMRQSVQPTYHIYQPPVNYPASYRPWHDSPQTGATPARTSGGFSDHPAPHPAPPPPAPSKARTSGGFSKTDPPKSSPTPSPRTSGGFSKPPQSAPAKSTPSSSPRTSGGFSKK